MGSADVHSVHRSRPLADGDSPRPGPDGKFGKSDVDYGRADSDQESCAKCRFFQAGSCQLVRGKIDDKAWCDLWTPRAPQGTGAAAMNEDANGTPDERARTDGDSDDDDHMAEADDLTVACKVCGGSAVVDGRKCRACKGTGRTKALDEAEELNPKKLKPALSEDALARFYDLSDIDIKLSGDPDVQAVSWVPVFPEGTFYHPEYGELVFDDVTIPRYIKNFDDRVRHIDIAVDVDHRNEEAVGWVKRLDWRRGVGLFGLVEWNRLGLQKVQDKQYRYISAQFGDYKDEQTRDTIDNVISALTITNFPFLKRMTAIQLSEQDRLRRAYDRIVKLHSRIHKGTLDVPEKLHKRIDLWLEGRTLKSLPTSEQRLTEGRAILAQSSRFLAAMGPNGSSKGGGKLPHEKSDFAPGDNADEGGPALDDDADLDDDSGDYMKKSKKARKADDDDTSAKKVKRAALLAQLKALDDDELDDDDAMDDDEMKRGKKAYDQDDAYGEGANMDVHKDKSAQPTRARGQKPTAPDLAGKAAMSEGSGMQAQLAELRTQLGGALRQLREGKVKEQAKFLSEGRVAFGKEVVGEFRKVALADKAAGEQLFKILSLIKEDEANVILGEFGSANTESDEDGDVIQMREDGEGGIVVGMKLSEKARAYAKKSGLDFNDQEDRLLAFEAVTSGMGDVEDRDARPARAKGWR